jgi:hypothetical protein
MMPYRGKTPAIGWCLHMTGGWRTQWERIQRWYERATLTQNYIDRYDFLCRKNRFSNFHRPRLTNIRPEPVILTMTYPS